LPSVLAQGGAALDLRGKIQGEGGTGGAQMVVKKALERVSLPAGLRNVSPQVVKKKKTTRGSGLKGTEGSAKARKSPHRKGFRVYATKRKKR